MNMNPDSEARRESARQADGKFGPQEYAEPAGGTEALDTQAPHMSTVSETESKTEASIFSTAEGYKAGDILRDVEMISADLRELAGRIEYIAKNSVEHVGESGVDTYSSIASRIHHELYSMLANARLGALINDAGEADIYRAKAELS